MLLSLFVKNLPQVSPIPPQDTNGLTWLKTFILFGDHRDEEKPHGLGPGWLRVFDPGCAVFLNVDDPGWPCRTGFAPPHWPLWEGRQGPRRLVPNQTLQRSAWSPTPVAPPCVVTRGVIVLREN